MEGSALEEASLMPAAFMVSSLTSSSSLSSFASGAAWSVSFVVLVLLQGRKKYLQHNDEKVL
jgi:hypothetical protein